MDMMEITDEQRAWIKTRRKRRLRVLAAVLCLSVLFTTYPNILEAFSVFAAENGAEENILYVSGFSDLPEGVREQTVPVGTGLEELTLPDTLEATVQTGQNAADQDEDADRRETEDADEGTEKMVRARGSRLTKKMVGKPRTRLAKEKTVRTQGTRLTKRQPMRRTRTAARRILTKMSRTVQCRKRRRNPAIQKKTQTKRSRMNSRRKRLWKMRRSGRRPIPLPCRNISRSM